MKRKVMIKHIVISVLLSMASITAQGAGCLHPLGVVSTPDGHRCNDFLNEDPNSLPFLTLGAPIYSHILNFTNWKIWNIPHAENPPSGGRFAIGVVAISIAYDPVGVRIPGTPWVGCTWHVPFDTVFSFTMGTPSQTGSCQSTPWLNIPAGIFPPAFSFYAQCTFLDPNEPNSVAVTNSINITVQ